MHDDLGATLQKQGIILQICLACVARAHYNDGAEADTPMHAYACCQIDGRLMCSLRSIRLVNNKGVLLLM